MNINCSNVHFDILQSLDFSNLEEHLETFQHLPLYEEGLKEVQEGNIQYRCLRWEPHNISFMFFYIQNSFWSLERGIRRCIEGRLKSGLLFFWSDISTTQKQRVFEWLYFDGPNEEGGAAAFGRPSRPSLSRNRFWHRKDFDVLRESLPPTFSSRPANSALTVSKNCHQYGMVVSVFWMNKWISSLRWEFILISNQKVRRMMMMMTMGVRLEKQTMNPFIIITSAHELELAILILEMILKSFSRLLFCNYFTITCNGSSGINQLLSKIYSNKLIHNSSAIVVSRDKSSLNINSISLFV